MLWPNSGGIYFAQDSPDRGSKRWEKDKKKKEKSTMQLNMMFDSAKYVEQIESLICEMSNLCFWVTKITRNCNKNCWQFLSFEEFDSLFSITFHNHILYKHTEKWLQQFENLKVHFFIWKNM